MPKSKFSKLPKLLTVFAFLIIISITLSACSYLPFGKKSQGPVEIEYWGLWESPTVMDAVIKDYQKIKPNVTITYKKRTPQQYRETLESQIQAGKGPDVFRFHNTWTPMLKEELDPVPSSVVSNSEFAKNFYPVVSSDLKQSGKYVGVPLEIDGLALFYNEDILLAAGITAPPKTWSEFAQIAAKLTVKDTAGNIQTAGGGIGTASNIDHFSDILGLMILQNGGDPKSPKDKRTADALEYYTRFAQGQNRIWDETMPASTVAFTGGNLAMYFGPSWRAIEIKNANPTLKFKVTAVPQLEANKNTWVTWASYWAEGVSAKSTKKEAAWEFVKYLQQDETQIKLYSQAASTQGRFLGEPYSKISLAAKIAADPFAGAYVAQAPYARSAPIASRTFDNGLNDQIIKAYEDAINRSLAGSPANLALESTANNVATILARFTAPAPAK
ncbi:MAG: extracellular solute-binding protein [Candidatus Curtissbacteria bacterium]|nr:extracellular solute-binding protein [Candidatus Curtissbacteria bacterium]